MNYEETLHKVTVIVDNVLCVGLDEITPSLSLRENCGADEHDMLEILRRVDIEFQTIVPEPVIDSLDTIENIVDYLIANR